MFGSNNNNQLGVGDSTNRSVPSRLAHSAFKSKKEEITAQDTYRKPRYKQVALSKNHSLIVTRDGELFSCGIGSRGRLGHGFEDLNNYYRFKKVEFFSDEYETKHVKEVAISNNHSLVLTSDNEVYSWGLNSFKQLGYESNNNANYNQKKGFLETFEANPTLVLGDLRKYSKPIIGISVSKVHSVAYSKNELFFWGLNVGQMGIPASDSNIEVKLHDTVFKGEIQGTPKMVLLKDDIKCLDTTELCTWLVTDKNDIHVYYNYQHFKLPKVPVKASSDKHFDLFKPTILTQVVKIKKIVSMNHEFCSLLLENGSVMTCTPNIRDIKNTKFTSVWKAYDHDMVVTDIDVSNDGSIVLCTRNGSVFIKSSHSNQRKNSMSEASLPIPVTKNKFKKIDNLNKVVRVCCDFNFLSFGFVRDDVDVFPLKLQKNDFFKDINYLSCLHESDFSRKQEQLLKVDHKFHTYISNFIYPDSSVEDVDNDGECSKSCSRYHAKFDSSKNKRPKVEETLDLISDSDDQQLANSVILEGGVLCGDFSDEAFLESNKGYDCKITFAQYKGISLGIHKKIFEVRSKVFERIFNPKEVDELFEHGNFVSKYNSGNSVLHIESKIEIESVLLLIHLIYTSKTLDLWKNYLSMHSYPSHLKKIFSEYTMLLDIFKVSNSFKAAHGCSELLKTFQKMIDNSGDVIIRLNDGEMRCHSYILRTRSAFFETVLSPRWDTMENKELDFSGLSRAQFSVILKHLYGYNDYAVFDSMKLSFSESDEFVNELLEMIEIADELLLFQLKALCQVVISDFISLDNVILLLVHADYLSAPKLFKNCCWYIHNNLEILLFDTSFKDLPLEIIEKLESQIKYFENCKILDFANEKGELNYEMLSNVFEKRSSYLINLYMNNMPLFNEFFISDRKGFMAFEPLIDVKYENKKIAKDAAAKRRKSRKSSNVVSSEINDFRTNISPKEKENLEKWQAIDDSHDSSGEFELVINRSRQKKVDFSSPSPTPPNSNPTSRTSSVSNVSQIIPKAAITTTKPVAIPVPSKTVMTGLSPYSNWASKSSGSSILSDRFQQPSLGKSVESGSSPEWPKKTSKVKIGPVMKLSQKERKKMAAAAAAAELKEVNVPKKETSSPVNPWGLLPTTPIVPTSTAESVKVLPILGSSNSSNQDKASSKKKSNKTTTETSTATLNVKLVPPTRTGPLSGSSSLPLASALSSSCTLNSSTSYNSVYSTPSLTEVMIEESLRVEREKLQESERKTLAEVQKEQEFAKWWEEESLRVQKQMSMDSGSSNNKSKPKSRKGSNSNGRRKSEGASNNAVNTNKNRTNVKTSSKSNDNSNSNTTNVNVNNNTNHKKNKKKTTKDDLREEQLAF